MKELYILDEDLNLLGIIDDYASLIWAKRYNDVGDCEIYISATKRNLTLLKRNYYVARLNESMICRIKKVELETDSENGNYLTVTGYDCLDILDQRIIWNQLTFKGTVEDYIIRIIRDAFNMDQLQLNPPVRTQRQILNFKIASRERGLTDGINEQVQYDNVGEKVRSLCKTFSYGCKVYKDEGNLVFDLYKGIDRSNEVIFSPNYENLITSDYIEDGTDMGNVALVAGREEGTKRISQTSNHTSGIERYEMYIDASGTNNTCTWLELKTLYPPRTAGGIGYIEVISPTYIVYRLDYLDVILIDNVQFNELKITYPTGSRVGYRNVNNTFIQIQPGTKSLDELKALYPGKILLFQIDNCIAANLTTAKSEGGTITPPQDSDSVTIANIIYNDFLLNKGYEEIAIHGLKKSFDGTVEDNITFNYKEDYDLGDIVQVENEYGISSKARITEIIEVDDESGYSVEPKFEFIPESVEGVLSTENSEQ